MTQLLNLVNEDRAKEGLEPVCQNAKILKAAKLHNDDMIDNGFFSHTGSDGSQPWDRISNLGYNYKTVGSLLRGQTTVESVYDTWMNSDGSPHGLGQLKN